MRPLRSEGFTLLECLISIAISSVIIALFYLSFGVFMRTEVFSSSEVKKLSIYRELIELFSKDIRQFCGGSITVSTKEDGTDILAFLTHRSLFFNNSIPVHVRYYVEDSYLVREEWRRDMEFSQKIKLIHGVKSFKVFFYNGYDYVDEPVGSKMGLVRIRVGIGGDIYEIFTGNFLMNRESKG